VQIKCVESKQGTNTEKKSFSGENIPIKFLQVFAAPLVSWSSCSHHAVLLRSRTKSWCPLGPVQCILAHWQFALWHLSTAENKAGQGTTLSNQDR